MLFCTCLLVLAKRDCTSNIVLLCPILDLNFHVFISVCLKCCWGFVSTSYALFVIIGECLLVVLVVWAVVVVFIPVVIKSS
jgi:hypothetical protein